MAEADDANKALVALGVGPAAKELYVDLLKPAAAELGENLVTVAKVVTLAMAPLRGLVWGAEKMQDWLSTTLLRRLATVAPEKIQSPPLHIAGQVLLQLPFCAEEADLREMYANLLASSMNRDTVFSTHPAFVHVIQQLTSDEAIVLKYMASRQNFSFREKLDAAWIFRGEAGRISDQFEEVCVSAGARRPESSRAYLDNLLRLKIFTESRFSESKYRPGGVARWGDYGPSVEYSNLRDVELSDFGLAFVRACVDPNTAERATRDWTPVSGR